jgi:hypothetical protein
MTLLALCVGSAFYALEALSVIRVQYLATRGIPAQAGPFMAIQIGVLVAAIYLSYRHAHPYAEQWAAQNKEKEASQTTQVDTETTFDTLVGTINGNIDLLDTLLAQAGHHVRVDESNVRRQAPLYVRRVILSQPEPTTTERLFPEKLPEPTTLDDAELKAFLIGVADVPSFEKLITQEVVTRREEIRTELREMEDQLRSVELEKLIPPKDTAAPASESESTSSPKTLSREDDPERGSNVADLGRSDRALRDAVPTRQLSSRRARAVGRNQLIDSRVPQPALKEDRDSSRCQ